LNPKLEASTFAKPDLPGINIYKTQQPRTAQAAPSINAHGEGASGDKHP
jgi:hypothetical protein